MKRVLCAAIVMICIGSGTQLFAAGQRADGGQLYRVAVSLPPANNAWQAALLDSVQREIRLDTDEFSFVVNNAVDDADQFNTLQTYKDGNYDMIIVLPGNGTLMTPICEEIYAAGTKLMIVDRPIEGDTYTVLLAGDNYGAGANAARVLGQRLGGQGQIAVLRSYVGIPIDLERYRGFTDVLRANYPGIRILVEGDGEFNQEAGLRAMSNILPAYPRIDAVYSQDDEAAIGAITAIENARRTDIQFVTGMGGSRSAYARLQARDPLFAASMSYFPTMGGDAIRLAKRILRGERFEKENILPSVVVTSDNVHQFVDNAY